MTMEARIAAYLDGELDARAAAEVEAALLEPAVAELLSEELMVRELLASMPPDSAPEALIRRLEHSLGVGTSVTARLTRQVRAAWGSSRRALGAPTVGATALALARAGMSGARVAASGVSTVRASVALVADLPLPGRAARRPKPLWRRAAAYLWRRRK